MKLPNINIKNKKLLGFSFILLFLLLTTSYLIATTARAQEETMRTFTITPPAISEKLDPGGKAEGVLKVINDTDRELTFTVVIKDFIVEDNQGTPKFIPMDTLSNKYSASSWIGVYPSTFSVGSHQKQLLNYFIQIPSNARPGGHYAGVLYSPTGSINLKSTGTAVNTQAGTLFYVGVNGPIKESATITKFFANGFAEYGPVNILTQIKNFGDMHIRPKGYITVSDMLGRKAVLPLKENNIFPQAARDYQNAFGGKLMIGRFKAELLASYGANNNLPLVATVYFWVFPWKIAAVIALIAVAIILGVLYYRKNVKNSSGKKSSEKPETQKASEVSDTK